MVVQFPAKSRRSGESRSSLSIAGQSLPYQQQLNAAFENLADDALLPARKAAVKLHRQQGFPTRQHEVWKYVDLKPLLSNDFVLPTTFGESVTGLEPAFLPHLFPEMSQSRLVFVNGHIHPNLSNTRALPSGVTCMPLSDALDTHGDQVLAAVEQLGETPDEVFSTLNTALVQDGVFLEIADNVDVAQPIQLVFLTKAAVEQPMALYPRCIIRAGKHSRVSLVIQQIGLTSGVPVLHAPVVQLAAAEGARVFLSRIQDESTDTYFMGATYLHQAKDSTVEMTATVLGGCLSHHTTHVQLTASGAGCFLRGLNVLDGEVRSHQRVVMHHQQPHCASHQIYKSILDGKSRAEFDGTIVVDRNAQQTQADQMSKCLMLSDAARALTRPQLRIDADDVKCDHGATVGQLSDEEIFYLRSRGLDQDVATCLLTFGFAEDVLAHIPAESVRMYLEDRILKNLGLSHDPRNCLMSCTDKSCHL